MTQQNRAALITGASSGIGRETARLLARQGYAIIATARRLDRLKALADELPNVTYRQVDFADPEQVEGFCRELEESGQLVNVLVNNAGYSIRGVVEDVPLEKTRRLFQVNVFSVVRLIKACLPAMRKARTGAIVNLSSVSGKFSFPANGNYSATKHALEAYTESLRVELAPLGIRVVAIRPGPITTEFNEVAGNMTGDLVDKANDDYRPVYEANVRLFQSLFGEQEVPGPERVAEAILKAVTAPEPLPAYSVGPMAAEYLPLRFRLSEEEWGRFIMERMGLEKG